MHHLCTGIAYLARGKTRKGSNIPFKIIPMNSFRNVGCVRPSKSIRVFEAVRNVGDVWEKQLMILCVVSSNLLHWHDSSELQHAFNMLRNCKFPPTTHLSRQNERCLMNAYANYRFLIHLHAKHLHIVLMRIFRYSVISNVPKMMLNTCQNCKQFYEESSKTWRHCQMMVTWGWRIGKSIFNYMHQMILFHGKVSRFSFHQNYII